jgi:DNA polymerase
MSNVLVIVDLAQIEARILAWFAGQEDLLKGFANGKDIYSEFATTLFGHIVRKKCESDSPDAAKIFTIQRSFGKDTILGCGYGMGTTKFYSRCLANSDLKPAFDNGTYDFAFIEKLIKTYRTKYPLIPKFWTNIEKAFRWVVKYPQEIIKFERFLFTFWNECGIVNVQLPSGRVLKYPHARIRKGDNSLIWEHGHLWGGSITENLDQAVARDILAEAILRMEDAGIPIVLHAHDEIVGLIPKWGSEDVLAAMIENMCTPPSWAIGLPIAAEGKIVKKYEK